MNCDDKSDEEKELLGSGRVWAREVNGYGTR